jgi:hypothetical protein
MTDCTYPEAVESLRTPHHLNHEGPEECELLIEHAVLDLEQACDLEHLLPEAIAGGLKLGGPLILLLRHFWVREAVPVLEVGLPFGAVRSVSGGDFDRAMSGDIRCCICGISVARCEAIGIGWHWGMKTVGDSIRASDVKFPRSASPTGFGSQFESISGMIHKCIIVVNSETAVQKSF